MMTIARLHAFRRILLTLLRMVEEDLYQRGALRENADPRPLAPSAILRTDE